MKTRTSGCRLILLGVVVVIAGCSGIRQMMPTPNVYLTRGIDPYQDLDPQLKNTEIRLFYITDRVPERDDEDNLRYGYGRSSSLAFGSTVVDLGADFTWEELLLASRTQKRLRPVELALGQVTELVRGPDTPLPYALVDGKIVEEPSWVARREQAAQQFRNLIVQKLALTPRKEIFLYIHGYSNTFEDAAFALAELWHFIGRIGVPIIYTWPSGHPGLFGYTYDRESSEFTVYHLREALGFIAGFPEVEKIHIIAHSRGTDVAIAALRELTIAARSAGEDPREKLKIHNFVLAAPDIDLQVADQRISGDKLPLSAKRFTVYTSPADKAIGAARVLFQSPRGRVGTYGPKDVPANIRSRMGFGKSNFTIVNFSGTSDALESQGDRYGHSYFRDAPTVSSDLVLMLRDDLDAGTPGRPLVNMDWFFWSIPPGYPDKAPGKRRALNGMKD